MMYLISRKIIFSCYLLFFSFSCKSVDYRPDTDKKQENTQLLQKEVDYINTHYGTIDNLNRLDRLDFLLDGENESWLLYYKSLLAIRLSFIAEQKQKEILLQRATNNLKELEKKKIDNHQMKSEIYTLNGYLLYAEIAKNPSQNGPLLYKDVAGMLSKALELNEHNLRAQILQCIFENSVSKFLTSNPVEGSCSKLNQLITQLDSSEKTALYPYWGKNEAEHEIKQNCKQN